MTEKVLKKTGLVHLVDNIKKHFLPLTGGTISGDLTVQGTSSFGGRGKTIGLMGDSVNIMDPTQSTAVILNGGGGVVRIVGKELVAINGNSIVLHGEKASRDEIIGIPSDTEIPTVKWVKDNALAGTGKGFKIRGDSALDFVEISDGGNNSDFFYDNGENIAFSNDTSLYGGFASNFTFGKTGMFLVSGTIVSPVDIAIEFNVSPTFNASYVLDVKAEELVHFCFPLRIRSMYGAISHMFITDYNGGSDLVQPLKQFEIYFTRLCTII